MGERLERYVPKALSAHRVQCCHDAARTRLYAVDNNVANFYLLPAIFRPRLRAVYHDIGPKPGHG